MRRLFLLIKLVLAGVFAISSGYVAVVELISTITDLATQHRDPGGVGPGSEFLLAVVLGFISYVAFRVTRTAQIGLRQ